MDKFKNFTFADLVAIRDETKKKARWAQISLKKYPNAVPEFLTASQKLVNTFQRLSLEAQEAIDEWIDRLLPEEAND